MKEPYKYVRVGKRCVREHRLVMEKMIGQPIPKGLEVHHINGDTKDNREENLQLLPKGEHRKLHAAIDRAKGRRLTDEQKAEHARARAAAYKASHYEEVLERNRKYYWKNHAKCLDRALAYKKAHKEELKIKDKQYREKNHEKILAKQKRYNKENAVRKRAEARIYRQQHLEEIKEKSKAYREANKQQIGERVRQWCIKHREELSIKRKQKRANRTEEQIAKEKAYHRQYYLNHKNCKKKEGVI